MPLHHTTLTQHLYNYYYYYYYYYWRCTHTNTRTTNKYYTIHTASLRRPTHCILIHNILTNIANTAHYYATLHVAPPHSEHSFVPHLLLLLLLATFKRLG